MPGTVFFETFRRTWKATLLWGIGVASMALYVVLIIPDIKMLQQYASLLQNSPKFLVMLGGSDIDLFATPEGFLGYAFFGWIMLILATYGVLAGLAITANEEESGILDMMIALPLPRWRIVIEKFLAYTVNVVIIALISFLTIWLSTVTSTVFKNVTFERSLTSSLNMVPSVLLTIAVTALLATVFRRRIVAASLAGVFVVVSYLIDMLARSSPATEKLSVVSFFSYYNGGSALARGVEWTNIGLLTVVAIVLIAMTTALFQRRDVGL